MCFLLFQLGILRDSFLYWGFARHHHLDVETQPLRGRRVGRPQIGQDHHFRHLCFLLVLLRVHFRLGSLQSHRSRFLNRFLLLKTGFDKLLIFPTNQPKTNLSDQWLPNKNWPFQIYHLTHKKNTIKWRCSSSTKPNIISKYWKEFWKNETEVFTSIQGQDKTFNHFWTSIVKTKINSSILINSTTSSYNLKKALS